ncbi:alpha-amylase family glycosyl hydrolase [Clostridium sp. HCP1S3_B4]|uniref:alpha-amylase family glycosyl hydrolase n=1 Tax=unclassified Clostridium TaxID=2614128 RepID=UPI003F8B169D
MVGKSIKRLIALVTMSMTLFSTTLASAADTIVNDSTTKDSTSSNSDDLFQNVENGDMEGILKVNVDDNGDLTYQEPVGKTALEQPKGDWGDKVYTEDRVFSWDNVNMYFVITDRFVNGETSNDHSYGRGQDGSGKEVAGYDTKAGYWHGGDIVGLTQKIEDGYFDNLGTDAIWITAPYEQIHGGMCADGFKHFAYHGYWVLDYTEPDKNIGTAEEFEKFVDTAHSHGIRVVMDIVMNHAGYTNAVDANEYGYGGLNPSWKDVYFGDEGSMHWWNDYSVEAVTQGKPDQYTLNSDANWDNFWGPQWVRLRKDRFGSYSNQAPEESGVETCLDGLPDFVTEGTTDPGMPAVLKTKWNSEDPGKLAQEEKEMTEFCSNYGMKKCVKTYIVKWLTDWVRDYGVDGFRCDTAKHVTMDCWGDLKKAGVQALNEWRKANPDKPGAKWTDNFWMTGESWGHGVGKDGYYTSGGFDSMINFSYQGNEGKTGASLDGVYSGYAKQINSDPSFNALSYISSHDTALGDRSANAGTALLLTPGGVQTYYGDESGRKGDGTPQLQPTRSNMNWDSIDQSILSNWQKVGQFRTEHIAVGAGTHTKLSESPYTFSRVYDKNGVSDKVVISLPGKSGSCKVDCGTIFDEGASVIDYYTGNEYVVSDGTVDVTAGDNGVVLLSQGQPSSKAVVSASVASGDFYEDPLAVTLKVMRADKGTYSINGEEEVEFKDGDKITIADKSEIGDTFTLELKATGEDGEEVTKSYTYKKAEKPIIKNLIIHAKNSAWKNPINAYVYGTDAAETALSAKWPGDPMTKGDDGWYTIEYDTTDAAKIIFNCGESSPDRDPADMMPGFEKQGECWYLDGKWYDYNPESPKVEGITANPTKGKVNKETTFTAKASGGSGTLSYEFFNGTTSIGKSEDGKCTWKPDEAGSYKIKVVVTDESKNSDSAQMTYTVSDDDPKPPIKKLSIKSVEASSDTIKVGDSTTISVVTENGTGDVQYKFSDGKTVLQKYSSESEYVFEPTEAGDYVITVTAKDEDGNEDSKDIKIKVDEKTPIDPPIGDENPVTLASFKPDKQAPQTVGTKVTFTATAEDGVGDIVYAFYINGSSKPAQKGSKNTFAWTPAEEGTYTIKVVITDDSEESSVENDDNTAELTYKVTKSGTTTDPEDPTEAIKVSLKANSDSIQVGKEVKFTAETSNADGDVTYTFYVDGKKKQSSASNEFVWTPAEEGSYKIQVEAVDEEGNTAEDKIDEYKVSNSQKPDEPKDDPESPTGDPVSAMPMVVLGAMALGYVAYSKKTKQAR